MDVKNLKVFQAVARAGGMNGASEVLHTVQSNVTARIRALEEELGVQLFNRHSRGVSLTRAGERLLPFAKKMESLLQEAIRTVKDDGTPQGLLTIGSLETTAAQRLSPIITAYGREFPRVNLVLRTATNALLIEQVLASELDGAFVCAPVNHSELASDIAFREELVIVSAAGHKSLELIFEAPEMKILVKGPGCAYRSRLETTLSLRGITPAGRMEFGTIEAILGCVEAGLGITLLPRGLVQEAEQSGRVSLHELPSTESRIQIVFTRRSDAAPFSALEAFMRFAIHPTTLSEAAE